MDEQNDKKLVTREMYDLAKKEMMDAIMGKCEEICRRLGSEEDVPGMVIEYQYFSEKNSALIASGIVAKSGLEKHDLGRIQNEMNNFVDARVDEFEEKSKHYLLKATWDLSGMELVKSLFVVVPILGEVSPDFDTTTLTPETDVITMTWILPQDNKAKWN